VARLGRQRTQESRERAAAIVELRRQRVAVIDIAAQFSISPSRVSQIYMQTLREIPAMAVAELRAEDAVLIDDAINDLLEIARDHTRPRTAVEAWTSIRGFMERRGRMMGSDAPSRIEVSDATDQAIRKLAADLAGGLGELERGGETAPAGDAAAG
jgi:hypothetical protein